MANNQPKPVTLCAATAFKLDGAHIAAGQIVENVDPELAKELAGQGRARLATEDDIKAAAKAAKAVKPEAAKAEA